MESAEDFDPHYAVHDLETSPSKWLTKKKSLDAVYKSLNRYIGNNCSDLGQIAFESRIDFNAIAEHGDEQQIVQLLKLFLMTAIRSPKNGEYIGRITTKLDEADQLTVAAVIKEVSYRTVVNPSLLTCSLDRYRYGTAERI